MEVRMSDVATLPNLMSSGGFVLVMKGINEGLDTPEGAAYAFTGRVLDILDGNVARMTGQESDFGAGLDAGFDKLAVLATVFHEVNNDIAPRPVAYGILAQNAVNSAVTLAAIRKHPEEKFRPPKTGKRAMFAQNLALGAYSIGRAIESDYPRLSKASRLAAHCFAAAGLIYYGLPATSEMIDRL